MKATKTEIIILFIGCFTGAAATYCHLCNYSYAAVFISFALLTEYFVLIPAKRTENFENIDAS